MKKMTKKEFTKETMNIIQNLNDEELEMVRKGLYILYKELKGKGYIEFSALNELSCFLLDIGCMAATETSSRMRE